MDEGVEILTPTQEESSTLPKSEKGKDEKREVMGIPEMVVHPEKGIWLMSIALKMCNPEWGNRNHELARLTEQYFREHPLNPAVKNTIAVLEDEGVDEETLYYLSLTYQHSERDENVFTMLKRHKNIEKPEKLQQKLLEALGTLDSDLDSEPSFADLRNKFREETKRNIEVRQEQLGESRQRIGELITYFRPKSETTPLKRINLMPTNFLYPEKSGKSFMLGEELVLMSPVEDSTDGQAHEFLHSVINPIVDKLDDTLTKDQKRKITRLTSGKLRQHYGEEYYSLLSEDFIRTYINIFEKGKRPQTYQDLETELSRITTEKQFQNILAEDSELEQRINALGASDLKGLNEKTKEYFELYEKDQLQDIIYGLYQDYARKHSNNPTLTFEDFVLQNFSQRMEETL
jgi:hypothetical protein